MPTPHILFIRTGKTLPKQIRIYNNIGQLLIDQKGENNEIDVSHLPNSMYQLEIVFENKKIQKRIVKN